MRFLTRDEIIDPTELKVIEVETPELGEGVGVRMRELGAASRYRMLSSLGDTEPILRFYSVILAESLIDENGERFCTGDAEAICERSVDLVLRLGKLAAELSSIDISKNDIEDDIKN